MNACLTNAASLKNKDPIRMDDGSKSVGDRKRGPVFSEPPKCRVDRSLGGGIER